MRALALFCLISVVVADPEADSTSDCNPWPSNLKPVSDCCNIPGHSQELMQHICYTKCALKSVDTRSDCTIECYANLTGIIKDGSFNKAAAIRIYENNAYSDRHQWQKWISEGVEKCEYDSSGSLTENLVKFYNCVDDFLARNCVSFIQCPECSPVEEYFEKCNNVQANCTVWPRTVVSPEMCCKVPPIFTHDLNSKCRNECNRKEFLLLRQNECVYNCTWIATGLKTGNKIDFEVVKKMLMDGAGNKSDVWEKSIEKAVQTCQKTLSGNDNFKFFFS